MFQSNCRFAIATIPNGLLALKQTLWAETFLANIQTIRIASSRPPRVTSLPLRCLPSCIQSAKSSTYLNWFWIATQTVGFRSPHHSCCRAVSDTRVSPNLWRRIWSPWIGHMRKQGTYNNSRDIRQTKTRHGLFMPSSDARFLWILRHSRWQSTCYLVAWSLPRQRLFVHDDCQYVCLCAWNYSKFHTPNNTRMWNNPTWTIFMNRQANNSLSRVCNK